MHLLHGPNGTENATVRDQFASRIVRFAITEGGGAVLYRAAAPTTNIPQFD